VGLFFYSNAKWVTTNQRSMIGVRHVQKDSVSVNSTNHGDVTSAMG